MTEATRSNKSKISLEDIATALQGASPEAKAKFIEMIGAAPTVKKRSRRSNQDVAHTVATIGDCVMSSDHPVKPPERIEALGPAAVAAWKANWEAQANKTFTGRDAEELAAEARM